MIENPDCPGESETGGNHTGRSYCIHGLSEDKHVRIVDVRKIVYMAMLKDMCACIVQLMHQCTE